MASYSPIFQEWSDSFSPAACAVLTYLAGKRLQVGKHESPDLLLIAGFSVQAGAPNRID